MNQRACLCDMMPGEQAVIACLPENAWRQRLLDIGFLENTTIECVGKSPAGDPAAYLVRGAVIALRKKDCADILIKERCRLWD